MPHWQHRVVLEVLRRLRLIEQDPKKRVLQVIMHRSWLDALAERAWDVATPGWRTCSTEALMHLHAQGVRRVGQKVGAWCADLSEMLKYRRMRKV